MGGKFGLRFRLPLKSQGSFTCRKSATWDRRLYRHAEDFFARKIRRLRPGSNPRSWEPKASMLTTRPPKPLAEHVVPRCCDACSLEEGEWKLANSVIGYTVPSVVWIISSALRSSCANPDPWISHPPPPPSPNFSPRPLMAQFLMLDQTSNMQRRDKEGKSLSTGAIVLTFNHSKKKTECHSWIVALCKVGLKNVRKSVVRLEHFEAQISIWGGKCLNSSFRLTAVTLLVKRTALLILYVEMIVVYLKRHVEYVNTLRCRMHIVIEYSRSGTYSYHRDLTLYHASSFNTWRTYKY
jgi:hypothetical protein